MRSEWCGRWQLGALGHRRILASLVFASLGGLSACSADRASDGASQLTIARGIERALNVAHIPVGEWTVMSAIQSQVEREDLRRRVLSRDRLDLLRKYEQAQLLSIRLVPQSSLEALGRMGAETYEFSPSEELRNAADSSENESASLKIPLATITIEEIVSDTAYSAPHLSQSEKYRLVLGRYRISPNAIQMRFDPSSRPEFFRFKALMRYDAFAKRYAFVTADWGREDETIWRTNNIP